jgi:hypothetical protein
LLGVVSLFVVARACRECFTRVLRQGSRSPSVAASVPQRARQQESTLGQVDRVRRSGQPWRQRSLERRDGRARVRDSKVCAPELDEGLARQSRRVVEAYADRERLKVQRDRFARSTERSAYLPNGVEGVHVIGLPKLLGSDDGARDMQ